MIKYIFVKSTSLLIVLMFVISCSQKPTEKKSSDDEQIIEMLKEFYTQYIIESDSVGNEKTIEALQHKYSTSRFLKKFDDEELDADPYINQQSFNKNWINTLSVAKTQKDKIPLYKVCFIITYNNTLNCVNVSVKKENNMWKIDDIIW